MHEADYPILSDVSKEIANKYGVLAPAGFARRWTFYIAPDGKILHIDKEVKPASSGPDMVGEARRAQHREAIAVSERDSKSKGRTVRCAPFILPSGQRAKTLHRRLDQFLQRRRCTSSSRLM